MTCTYRTLLTKRCCGLNGWMSHKLPSNVIETTIDGAVVHLANSSLSVLRLTGDKSKVQSSFQLKSAAIASNSPAILHMIITPEKRWMYLNYYCYWVVTIWLCLFGRSIFVSRLPVSELAHSVPVHLFIAFRLTNGSSMQLPVFHPQKCLTPNACSSICVRYVQ